MSRYILPHTTALTFDRLEISSLDLPGNYLKIMLMILTRTFPTDVCWRSWWWRGIPVKHHNCMSKIIRRLLGKQLNRKNACSTIFPIFYYQRSSITWPIWSSFQHKKCPRRKKGIGGSTKTMAGLSDCWSRTDWEILLQEVIGPTHVLFHSIHFGTLSLCVFLRRDLIWFCTGKSSTNRWFTSFRIPTVAEPVEHIVKFRAVNPRRTKGSLIINFNLFGTSFMIMNSHFEGKGQCEVSEVTVVRLSSFSGPSARRSFQSTIEFPKYRRENTHSRSVQIKSNNPVDRLANVSSHGSATQSARIDAHPRIRFTRNHR